MAKQALITSREFGPAMNNLTVSEQMFVCNLFTNYKSITKCAELAGYTAETRNALRVKAHRLLRDQRVSQAVIEESKRRTTFLLPKAQRALENVLADPGHADHMKAIKMVRDDGGASRIVEKILNINVNVSDADKLAKLKEFAENHGYDPAKFTGQAIEAEFTEVDTEAEDRELGIVN